MFTGIISAVGRVRSITPVAAGAPPIPAGAAAAVKESVPAVPVRLLNPQPVIDPALGIVVTEYFNRSGEMTDQYPSARAIDSYRIYGLHGVQDEPAAESDGSVS